MFIGVWPIPQTHIFIPFNFLEIIKWFYWANYHPIVGVYSSFTKFIGGGLDHYNLEKDLVDREYTKIVDLECMKTGNAYNSLFLYVKILSYWINYN